AADGGLHRQPAAQRVRARGRPDDDVARVRLQPGDVPERLGARRVHRPRLGGRPDAAHHRYGPQPHRASRVAVLRAEDERPLSEKRFESNKRIQMSKSIEVKDLNVYYGDFRAVEGVT